MPILIGSGLIASAGLLSLLTHYGLVDFSQQFVIAFGRFTVMGEAIAFLAALAVVIARARRKQTERDAQVIELLQAQLKLTEDLRQTDASYLNAMRLAQSRQDAIAFATHDMRQPLAALQVALDRAPSLSPDDRRSLEDLRAYLERIVEQFLNRSHEERSGGKSAAISPGAPEEVPVSIVLDAVSAMFAEDARASDILLKTAKSQLTAYADPMVLVRLLFEFCLERDPAFGDRKDVGWMSRAWGPGCILCHGSGHGHDTRSAPARAGAEWSPARI